jgi:hypothetical protein
MKNQKNKFFSLFLKMGNLFRPEIPLPDIKIIEKEAFINACKSGNESIVDYILSKISDNKHVLTWGCFNAIESSHFKISDKLIPYIINESTTSFAYHTFNRMCCTGNIDGIKYLFQEPRLNVNVWGILNTAYDDSTESHEGLYEACCHGQIEVVKFITSSSLLKEHICTESVDIELIVSEPELIRYFIFDLNLPPDNALIQNIVYCDKDFIPSMYEKKQLFLSLDKNLGNEIKLSKKRNKI